MKRYSLLISILCTLLVIFIPCLSVSVETMGVKNAVGYIKEYLEFSITSEANMREKLADEGFTDSEIEYAMANCGVDWNEQVLLYAKDCLKSYYSSIKD